jgi:GT2 family glycosyltransferase
VLSGPDFVLPKILCSKEKISPMQFSIIITTRNRLADLQQTLKVLAQLSPPPLEILLTADGCTDETVPFIRNEYKSIKMTVNAVGQGSVASRDRMMRAACGDLVLSLDDDSYPEQTDALPRLAKLFLERPGLAVAHFPQRSDEYPYTLSQTDFGGPQLTRSFANSGACFRRSAYLQLAGFEPKFFHMYEEPDYALQCVAAGFEVLFTPVITIRHHWSGRGRNEIRTHHQHARNAIWSAAMRCPFPFVVPIIGLKIIAQFRFAVDRGLAWIFREPYWWGQALAGLPSILKNRKPVSWAGYRQWLRLQDKQWHSAMASDPSFWKSREKKQTAG